MAVTVDQASLGNNVDTVSDTTVTLTTTAAVAAGGTIVVGVVWVSASVKPLPFLMAPTLTSEHPYPGLGFHGPGNFQQAICSAYCPNGLASSSTITVTFTGAVTAKMICASSFMGVAPGLHDTENSNFDANPPLDDPTWSNPMTTTADGDLLIAWGVSSNSVTDVNTVTSPYVELHQFAIGSPENNTAALVYGIAGTAGSYSPGGQWDTPAFSGIGQIGVALKAQPIYVAEVLADDPRAYYRMNEASGQPQDSSGNSNHTTAVTGTPTYAQAGAIVTDASDDAILFNSATPDFFNAPDHATLDLADVCSLEAWVKRVGTATTEQTIISKGSNGFFLAIENHEILFAKTAVAEIVRSTVTITDTSTWHHIVATKNGATSKIYLDGVDVTGTVTDQTLASTAIDMQIAHFNGIISFNGYLDEVAVYATALSAVRVAKHYAAGIGGYVGEVMADSPVAYYRMDEASGLPKDSSGNARHMTSVNGTPVYAQPGQVGSAMAFDGVNEDSQSASRLDVGDSFTISAWVKRAVASGSAEYTIFTQSAGGGGIYIYNDRLMMAKSVVDQVAYSDAVLTSTSEWYHLAVTKNGATRKLYINGAEYADVSGKSDLTCGVATPTYYIGSEGGSYFNGLIDEVALFDTDLSPERIREHYAAAISSPEFVLRDTFNRTDGALDGDTASESGTWFAPIHGGESSPNVVTYRLELPNTDEFSACLDTVHAGDVALSAKLVTVPSTGVFQLIARIQATDTQTYGTGSTFVTVSFDADGDTTLFAKHIDGVFTQFGTGSLDTPLAAGQEVGMRIVGNNVEAWHKPGATWILVDNAAIGTFPASSGKLGLYTEGGTTWVIDNFGGAFTSAGPTTPILEDGTGTDLDSLSANWTTPMFTGESAWIHYDNAFAPGSAAASAFWDTTTFGPGSEVYWTASQFQHIGNIRMFLKLTNGGTEASSTFYRGLFDLSSGDEFGGTFFAQIDKFIAGSQTVLTTDNYVAMLADDSVWFSVEDGVLSLWHQPGSTGLWYEVASVADSSIVGSGYIGMYSDSTAARFIDFGGGQLGEVITKESFYMVRRRSWR